jgi:hypothetical protein
MSGFNLRNTIIAMDTKTNAAKVPILTISAAILMGVKAATTAIIIPVNHVLLYGVLYLG